MTNETKKVPNLGANCFRPLATGLLVMAVSACSSTGSVLTLGPDTYRVSASQHNLTGGAPAAEERALQTAQAYCTNMGKQVLVTNTSSDFDRPLYTFSANFRCLAQGDADLQRPTYRSAPNLVIESR